MVVGPALPEVNAVQRARMAALAPLGREAAFRRVYQIPRHAEGEPGARPSGARPGPARQSSAALRRFAEPSYAELLDPDYRGGAQITTDAELAAWFDASPPPA